MKRTAVIFVAVIFLLIGVLVGHYALNSSTSLQSDKVKISAEEFSKINYLLHNIEPLMISFQNSRPNGWWNFWETRSMKQVDFSIKVNAITEGVNLWLSNFGASDADCVNEFIKRNYPVSVDITDNGKPIYQCHITSFSSSDQKVLCTCYYAVD